MPVVGIPWTDGEIETAKLDLPYDQLPASFRANRSQRAWQSRRFALGINKHRPVTPVNEDPPEGKKRPATDDEWEEYFAGLELTNEARAGLGESQDSTHYKLGDGQPIAVCFVGDIHAGADIDYTRFKSDMETIRDTDGLYAVMTGDATENSKTTLKSATALYSAAFTNPRDQIEYVKRRLGICRDKWLAICQGNHDSFDYRTAGIDRLAGVAAHLDKPYFTEKGGTIHLDVGDESYVVVVKHDWSGKSVINKGNSLRRFHNEWPWEWATADVVALAHLHDPYLQQQMYRGRVVTMVRGGTYKIHDGWAEGNGYRSSYGVPTVILYPREHKVIAFHGDHFTDAVAYLRAARSCHPHVGDPTAKS